MRDLAPFFHALLAGELRGITSLLRLSKSIILTPEERDHAGDVIRVDEIRHARLIQGLIPGGAPVFAAHLISTDDLSDKEIIARQPRVEGFLVRRAPLLYPEMTAEQVAILKDIIEDEKGHVRWSLGVRNRLGLRSVRALHRSPSIQWAREALKEDTE